MFFKKLITGGVGFFIGVAVFATATFLPARPAEARTGDAMAGLIIGGMTGLMLGSAIEANSRHRMEQRRSYCRSRTMNQRLLMREVLQNYRPECHERFVEYVMFDLRGYLTGEQQRQLLHMMDQRYNQAYCRAPYPPTGYYAR